MVRTALCAALLLLTACGRTEPLVPGTVPTPSLAVTPSELDFGEAPPGAEVRRTVALSARSKAAITGIRISFDDALPGGPAAPFAIGGAPTRVEWGSSAEITIIFRPQLPPGPYQARLRILSSGGSEQVDLKGRTADPCRPELCAPPTNPCRRPARCEAGECVYDPLAGAACDDGDACTLSDLCAEDGSCGGSALKCEMPPPAVCADARMLRTFATVGQCGGGRCTYQPQDRECPFGCVNGKCFDPCEGVVCRTPPSGCFQAEGKCEAGKCSYAPDDGKLCDDGQACTVNDVCKMGVCGGSPMVCKSPPAAVCTDPDNSRFFEEEGACVAGSCVYRQRDEFCNIACLRGRCMNRCNVSLAGGTGLPGLLDGAASGSRFDQPYSLAVDFSGNVFVNDTGNARIRQISNGQVSTVPGSTGLAGNHDVALDGAGGLLVALSGRIVRVFNGSQTILTGSTTTGFADGPADSARFGSEVSVVGNSAGQVFIADANNHRIRKLEGGVVTTHAGMAMPGLNDGPNAFAQFNHPHDLVLAGGTLFIADASNHLLRSISGGTTRTLAGSSFGFLNGAPLSSRFSGPLDVARDPEGALYLADTSNHCIRRITATRVTTFAGICTLQGYREGASGAALFRSPAGVAVGADGTFYVSDTQNERVRRIDCVP